MNCKYTVSYCDEYSWVLFQLWCTNVGLIVWSLCFELPVTSCFLMFIILVTAVVRPFEHGKRGTLIQGLELASLVAIWLTCKCLVLPVQQFCNCIDNVLAMD